MEKLVDLLDNNFLLFIQLDSLPQVNELKKTLSSCESPTAKLNHICCLLNEGKAKEATLQLQTLESKNLTVEQILYLNILKGIVHVINSDNDGLEFQVKTLNQLLQNSILGKELKDYFVLGLYLLKILLALNKYEIDDAEIFHSDVLNLLLSKPETIFSFIIDSLGLIISLRKGRCDATEIDYLSNQLLENNLVYQYIMLNLEHIHCEYDQNEIINSNYSIKNLAKVIDRFGLVNLRPRIEFWEGIYLLKSGRISKGLSIINGSIEYYEKSDDKFSNLFAYLALGDYLAEIGQIEEATSNFQKCLSLAYQKQNAMFISRSVLQLAKIAYFRGHPESAIQYLVSLLEVLSKPGNFTMKAQILYNLVSIYTELNKPDQANDYFEKLRDLAQEFPQINLLNSYVTYSQAIILKSKLRFESLSTATTVLYSVIEDESTPTHLKINALIALVEILLQEMKIFRTSEINNEIVELVEQLTGMIALRESIPLIIRVSILKSKLKILNFEIDEARTILVENQRIAKENSLEYLEQQVEKELKWLEQEFSEWYIAMNRNPQTKQNVEQFRLINYLHELSHIVR